MNSSPGKRVIVGAAAVALPLLAAFAASKNVDNVPSILVIAGLCVLQLCVLDQLMFSSGRGRTLPSSLGVSILRGGLAGLTSWLGMMLFIRFFVEVGDKFSLFTVFFLPVAIVFGAAAAGLASTLLRVRSSVRS